MNSLKEQNTQNKYNLNAEEWIKSSGGKDRPCYWEEQAKMLHELVGSQGLVIEVGSGPATDGERLKQLGLQCVSTDYSLGMLNVAQEINPLATLAVMDMKNTSFTDNLFDGFWATATLLHLVNPDQALKEISRITKPGGVGFISIKEGKGTKVSEKTGYFFRYYQDEEFRQILKKHGFEIIWADTKPGFSKNDWLMYVVVVP